MLFIPCADMTDADRVFLADQAATVMKADTDDARALRLQWSRIIAAYMARINPELTPAAHMVSAILAADMAVVSQALRS